MAACTTAQAADPIGVLLVEDHAATARGLAEWLNDAADLRLVGTASDGRIAVALALDLAPNVVVMDISLPGQDGIAATREIRARLPAVEVLGISASASDLLARHLLRRGARGFVHKRCSRMEFLDAVRTVARGDSVVIGMNDPESIRHDPPHQTWPGSTALDRLSAREREILGHIAMGMTSPQISVELCLALKTVETHRHNIMRKLGASNVVDLLRRTGYILDIR